MPLIILSFTEMDSIETPQIYNIRNDNFRYTKSAWTNPTIKGDVDDQTRDDVPAVHRNP